MELMELNFISFLSRPAIQSTNEKSFLCWWMKEGSAMSWMNKLIFNLFVNEANGAGAAANKTNQFTNQIQRQMNLMGIDGLFGGRFQLAFIICLHSLRSFHQITHFASSLTSIPSHSINNSTPVHCWFHLWFHSNVYN